MYGVDCSYFIFIIIILFFLSACRTFELDLNYFINCFLINGFMLIVNINSILFDTVSQIIFRRDFERLINVNICSENDVIAPLGKYLFIYLRILIFVLLLLVKSNLYDSYFIFIRSVCLFYIIIIIFLLFLSIKFYYFFFILSLGKLTFSCLCGFEVLYFFIFLTCFYIFSHFSFTYSVYYYGSTNK